MARLSRNGEQSLLGHAPRDPFASADPPPRSPYRNSDVDFGDVFGGPPRGSSISQGSHGVEESGGGRVTGGVWEEAAAPRRPWSCYLGDKPVFGGIGSPARRRQAGEGLFDDVFRGNESACSMPSTPRKMDRDVFSSNPCSRMPSPARPLPPACDVLSKRPAQPSLSTRLGRGSDYPAFGSHRPDVVHKNEKSVSDVYNFPSPVTCAPTSGRRLVQTKDNQKSDSHASFDESALPYKTPHSQYRSLEATKLTGRDTNGIERQPKEDLSGLQAYGDCSFFHFSMYKWASIGVTLVMPYNLKERMNSGNKASPISAHISQAADHPTDNQSTPQGCGGILCNQHDLEDNSLLSDFGAAENHDISLAKEVKEVSPAPFDTTHVQSDITDKLDGANVYVETWKPKPKNLLQPFNDYFDAEGDKEITGQMKNKESMNIEVKDANGIAKFEHATRENMNLRNTEKAAKTMHDSPSTHENKLIGSRAKGKVKDFINIFNRDASSSSSGTTENQARRPRIRNEARGKLEAHVSACATNADQNGEKMDNGALSTPPVAGNQKVQIGEKPAFGTFLSMQKMVDSSSEVNGMSPLFSDSIPDILDASFLNIEEAYVENIDDCLVEELCPNQIELTETDIHQEEIKKSDAKIQEWSKGKTGNIRSLLSTLQYVLWPGSGWKPVALVDIIEGASVRRAYQKALLCLHPDKLQQKGAEMHQKYIAEKVFDILQEAWTHFNSVSSL